MNTFTHAGRELTRRLMRQIDALPAPVKAVIGLVPGGGMVTGVSENHKWTVCRLAHHYASTGKLSPAARAAVREHERAAMAESQAYERLVRILDREL